DGTPRPVQMLDNTGVDAPPIQVIGQKVRWVLDLMRGTEFEGRQITSYEVTDTGAEHEITLYEAAPGDDRWGLAELKAEMLALGEQERTLRIFLRAAPSRRLLFDTGPIDGFGWACFTARDGDAPAGPVRGLANEHLRVEIDDATGTYAIET